jgi:hypothetical protein
MQEQDGVQRVFVVDGQEVARHNPYYARFLKNEVTRLGREHPLIRTQYFCENLDARSGMFTPAHRMLMRGDILPAFLTSPYLYSDGGTEGGRISSPRFGGTEGGRIPSPRSGGTEGGPSTLPSAFLLDVAGQEESSTSAVPDDSGGGFEAELNYSNEARDSVTLMVHPRDPLLTMDSNF